MVAMENQISVELKDRTLWFDGEMSLSTEKLSTLLLNGYDIDGLHPTEIDKNVKKFNLYSDKQLTLKETINAFNTDLSIPSQYKNLNIRKKLFELLDNEVLNNNFNAHEIENRISRVKQELRLFKEYGLEDLLLISIYIVDQFNKHNIVWGTGRGSSCACYSLYLIGIHEVDSVKYNLELNEFFR